MHAKQEKNSLTSLIVDIILEKIITIIDLEAFSRV